MLGLPHGSYAGVPLRNPLSNRGAPKRSLLARVGELLRAVGLWREDARLQLTWCAGVTHAGLTASPTLAQSIPHATRTPTTSPVLCPLPRWGRRWGERLTQDPHTPSVSLRPCELHLSWPLAWADLLGLLYTHAGPSLTTAASIPTGPSC